MATRGRAVPRGTATKLSRRMAKEFARSGVRITPSEVKRLLGKNPQLFWDNSGRSQVFMSRYGARVGQRRKDTQKPQTIAERKSALAIRAKSTKKPASEQLTALKFASVGRLFKEKNIP